jgi:low temperature requirement protein LtrA
VAWGVAIVLDMGGPYLFGAAGWKLRRLAGITHIKERNETARDSYSYLHLPTVAGIVLVALGMKKTIGQVGEPLQVEAAFALIGGLSLYLLAHVAFRLRNVRTLNRRRLALAIGLFALLPLAVEIAALATLEILTAAPCVLIAYETIRFTDSRDRVRHEMAGSLG